MRLIAAACLIGGLSACSTTHLVPRIDEFGGSVTSIAARDNTPAVERSLGERVAAARLRDFAREGVRFVTPGFGDDDPGAAEQAAIAACDYVRPDVARVPQRFRTGCRLVPLNRQERPAASVFDSYVVQSAVRPQDVVQTSDVPLLKEYLAFRLREDLKAYSEAILELATSREPEALGTASAQAFDAVVKLRDAIGMAASPTGTAPPPDPRRQAARTLIPLLAEEIAETLRYRRLRQTVEFADPFVSRAAIQLSILAYEREAAVLERRADTFQAERLPDDWGSLRNLRATEAAWEALAKADDGARYRTYSEIGATHRAILESLRAPSSIERLNDANKRIFELAEAIKAFAES